MSSDYNYPANSNAAKQASAQKSKEPEKAQQIVQGSKIGAPPDTWAQKIFKFFFVMTPTEIMKRVWSEVISPSIRSTLSDMIVSAKNFGLYGDDNGSGIATGNDGYTNYSNPSKNNQKKEPDNKIEVSDQNKAVRNFQNVAFKDKKSAEEVRQALLERLAQTKQVTVGYFYELTGVESEYPDGYYGWKSFSDLKAYPRRDGKWMLTLPKAEYLEK